MTVLPRRLPASSLGKARLAAALFAVVWCAWQLGNGGNPARPPAWNSVSSVAVVLVIGVVVTTYARGRVLPFDPVGLPVLVFVGGSGLADPVAAFGVCSAVTVSQSMYGSARTWAVRSVLLGAAFLAAVAVSPLALAGLRVSWHDPSLLSMVAQLTMLGVLARGLYSALLRQDLARERDATLAHVGGELIGVTELEQVRRVGADAATRLAQLSLGAVTVLLERSPDGFTVLHSFGMDDAVVGTVLPVQSVRGLDAPDRDTVRTVAGGVGALQNHTPGIRHWRGVGLSTAGPERYLLVGGAQPVSKDVVNAFRNLAHQIAFAEDSCRIHQRLNYQADHDDLTTLPNRGQFFKRLAAAIDEQVPVALLVIDLDDFKQVNDVHGHPVGDELLIEVAARLGEASAPNGVAARFGGDEFALLLTGTPAEVDAVAQRLCARLLEPMRLSAGVVTVGASIGVATAHPGLTGGDLMRCADIAMYSAKAAGKNRVERFSTARHGDIAQHRLLEEHLAYAVQRDEIAVHYQPYLDLRTGECVGVEALPRWQHRILGRLSPQEFMATAERTGHLTAIGAHILRVACRHLSAWTTLPAAADLRLSINVTVLQLLDPRFAMNVRQILTETGLNPSRVYLQIGASERLDQRLARQQLHELAEIGVRIALDHFRAGAVSQIPLRLLPIHQVKIEASSLTSTDRLHTDEMLSLIASMGTILDFETVAEGVETPEQADLLRAANIAQAQGDLFAAPMPADDLAHWLTNNRRRAATGLRRA
jgi:diguanylate cyclase (GGDEF)-like protein